MWHQRFRPAGTEWRHGFVVGWPSAGTARRGCSRTELSVCSTARISGAVGRSRPVKYSRDELGSQSKHGMHRANANRQDDTRFAVPAKSERTR